MASFGLSSQAKLQASSARDTSKVCGPCLLCPENAEMQFKSEKQYASHIGRHLENLALFALPRVDDDYSTGDERSSDGEDDEDNDDDDDDNNVAQDLNEWLVDDDDVKSHISGESAHSVESGVLANDDDEQGPYIQWKDDLHVFCHTYQCMKCKYIFDIDRQHVSCACPNCASERCMRLSVRRLESQADPDSLQSVDTGTHDEMKTHTRNSDETQHLQSRESGEPAVKFVDSCDDQVLKDQTHGTPGAHADHKREDSTASRADQEQAFASSQVSHHADVPALDLQPEERGDVDKDLVAQPNHQLFGEAPHALSNHQPTATQGMGRTKEETDGTFRGHDEPEPVHDRDTRPHKCSHCERSFDELEKLNRHKRNHHELHECLGPGCTMWFDTKSDLDRHWDDRHNRGDEVGFDSVLAKQSPPSCGEWAKKLRDRQVSRDRKSRTLTTQDAEMQTIRMVEQGEAMLESSQDNSTENTSTAHAESSKGKIGPEEQEAVNKEITDQPEEQLSGEAPHAMHASDDTSAMPAPAPAPAPAQNPHASSRSSGSWSSAQDEFLRNAKSERKPSDKIVEEMREMFGVERSSLEISLRWRNINNMPAWEGIPRPAPSTSSPVEKVSGSQTSSSGPAAVEPVGEEVNVSQDEREWYTCQVCRLRTLNKQDYDQHLEWLEHQGKIAAIRADFEAAIEDAKRRMW
ncbi:hypothetical protein B0T20DRAFT_112982 [Sordaria brevicollis]|uniref:C2H2-type domain-containing protein n=1 Tax=Sordaria brevicollis TaxID=83679 RepID=A0AAE0PK52_SORBR|nr:hypothetical protein B0T20DRAFT_112982 [Sordaria brevicollis]